MSAAIEVTNSGSDVPNAINVKLITISGIFRRFAIIIPLSTSILAPIITSPAPVINFNPFILASLGSIAACLSVFLPL